jgi:ELWxxDGT repeat protein
MPKIALAGLILCLGAVPGLAQTPTLPLDINTVVDPSPSSSPVPLAEAGTFLYFQACDTAHGCELWKTTGVGGATLVAETTVGPLPAASASHLQSGIGLGSLLITAACDAANGCEPWRSDGTAIGTFRLRDVFAGASSSDPFGFVKLGLFVYFLADDGVNGRELWKTDGSLAGTVLVKDINPGIADSDISSLVATPTKLIFQATSTVGSGLWTSDGTTVNTVHVSAIGIDTTGTHTDSKPPYAVALGETVIFCGNDPSTPTVRQELYKTDGTGPGTTLLADIAATALVDGSPTQLTLAGSTVYFTAFEDDTIGRSLWRTNGTPGGTVQVEDIDPLASFSSVVELTPLGATGSVLFRGVGATAAESHELWISNGTAAGTQLLLDIDPVDESFPRNLVAVGSKVFFAAQTALTGLELWVSDGTVGGTAPVDDLEDGAGGSGLQRLRSALGRVFFAGNDGIAGSELWTSLASTPTSATLVADVHQVGKGSKPQSLAALGAAVLFSADDGINGRELWKSDGTLGGTALVANIEAGAGSSDPDGLATAGSTVFFAAADTAGGRELWKSDGATATRVKDIVVGATGSEPANLTPLGNRVVFSADDGTTGREPWISDGTSGGTSPLGNLVAAAGSSDPRSFTPLATSLLFFANDAGGNLELWKTDGTPGGTALVRDLTALSALTVEGEMAAAGMRAFFFLIDAPGMQAQLWRTDGTSGGTALLVNNLSLGPDAMNPILPGNPVGLSSDVVFLAVSNGELALWKSDGTSPGTVVLRNNAGAGGLVQPAELTVFGSRVYFRAASNDDFEAGLWRCDGTVAGTFELLVPVTAGTVGPSDLAVAGGRLLFGSPTSTSGKEAWISTGKSGGSVALADIAAGAAGSAAGEQTRFVGASGRKVFFGADDGLRGAELWTATMPDDFASGFANGFESGTTAAWWSTVPP